MRERKTFLIVVAGLALLGVVCRPAPSPPASQAPAAPPTEPTRVVVGVTETLESQNPYGESNGLSMGI